MKMKDFNLEEAKAGKAGKDVRIVTKWSVGNSDEPLKTQTKKL